MKDVILTEFFVDDIMFFALSKGLRLVRHIRSEDSIESRKSPGAEADIIVPFDSILVLTRSAPLCLTLSVTAPDRDIVDWSVAAAERRGTDGPIRSILEPSLSDRSSSSITDFKGIGTGTIFLTAREEVDVTLMLRRNDARTMSFTLLSLIWPDDLASNVGSDILSIEGLESDGALKVSFDKASLCSMARLWGRERVGVIGMSPDCLSTTLGEADGAGNLKIFFSFPEELSFSFLTFLELSREADTPLAVLLFFGLTSLFGCADSLIATLRTGHALRRDTDACMV